MFNIHYTSFNNNVPKTPPAIYDDSLHKYSSLLYDLKSSETMYRERLSKLLACCLPLRSSIGLSHSSSSPSFAAYSSTAIITKIIRKLIAHHMESARLLNVSPNPLENLNGFLNWCSSVVPAYQQYVQQFELRNDMTDVELELKKAPLKRINHLNRFITKLLEINSELHTSMKFDPDLPAVFNKLTAFAKSKNEQENTKLDLNTLYFDRVRELNEDFTHTASHFNIEDVLRRECFAFDISHPLFSRKDFWVEVFQLKDNTIAVCSIESVGRSLLFPPLRIHEFRLMKGRLLSVELTKNLEDAEISLRLNCSSIEQVDEWYSLLKSLKESGTPADDFITRHNNLENLKNGRIGLGLHLVDEHSEFSPTNSDHGSIYCDNFEFDSLGGALPNCLSTTPTSTRGEKINKSLETEMENTYYNRNGNRNGNVDVGVDDDVDDDDAEKTDMLEFLEASPVSLLKVETPTVSKKVLWPASPFKFEKPNPHGFKSSFHPSQSQSQDSLHIYDDSIHLSPNVIGITTTFPNSTQETLQSQISGAGKNQDRPHGYFSEAHLEEKLKEVEVESGDDEIVGISENIESIESGGSGGSGESGESDGNTEISAPYNLQNLGEAGIVKPVKTKKRKSLFNIFSKKKNQKEPEFEIVTKQSLSQSSSLKSIPEVPKQPLSMAALNRNVKNLSINTNKKNQQKEGFTLPPSFAPAAPLPRKNTLTIEEEKYLTSSSITQVVKNSCTVSKWGSNTWEIIGNEFENEIRFLTNDEILAMAIYTSNDVIPEFLIPINNQETLIRNSSALDLQIRCFDSLKSNQIIMITIRCRDSKTLNTVLNSLEQSKSNPGGPLSASSTATSDLFSDGPSNSTSMNSINAEYMAYKDGHVANKEQQAANKDECVINKDGGYAGYKDGGHAGYKDGYVTNKNEIPSLGMPKLYGGSSFYKQHSASTISLQTPKTITSLHTPVAIINDTTRQMNELLLKNNMKIKLHKLDETDGWILISIGRFTLYSNVLNPEYFKFSIDCSNGFKLRAMVKNSTCERIGKSGLRFVLIDDEGQEVTYLLEFRKPCECSNLYELLQ